MPYMNEVATYLSKLLRTCTNVTIHSRPHNGYARSIYSTLMSKYTVIQGNLLVDVFNVGTCAPNSPIIRLHPIHRDIHVVSNSNLSNTKSKQNWTAFNEYKMCIRLHLFGFSSFPIHRTRMWLDGSFTMAIVRSTSIRMLFKTDYNGFVDIILAACFGQL